MDSALQSGLFALAGVLITAILGMVGIWIRHGWDVAAQAAAREHELERLELEVAASRLDRLVERRLDAATRFLGECQSIYDALVRARRTRDEGDEADYRRTSVSPIEGQVALELVRLQSSEATGLLATRLWQHIRGKVPFGRTDRPGDWARWKAAYWNHRAEFQTALRIETSVSENLRRRIGDLAAEQVEEDATQ